MWILDTTCLYAISSVNGKMKAVCNTARQIVQIHERYQVQLHGQYSHDLQQKLLRYCETTSAPRVACVLLLTPLPSVVMISLVDVPTLRDPADGVFANYVYWIRAGVVTVTMAAFFLLLFKEYIDGLSLRSYHLIIASLLTGLVVIALTFWLAQVVGFPLPFIVLCSGPPFVFVMASSGIVLWGKALYRDPAARRQLPNALGIVMSQWSLMIVYPAYNAMYIQLAGAAQAAFVLVLPLVKLLSTNLLVRFCRDMPDARAEIIVMNVEIFHALFSTYCMQASTSSMTIALVMVGDVIHACLSLRDVNALASEINSAGVDHTPLPTSTLRMCCSQRFVGFLEGDRRIGPRSSTILPTSPDQYVKMDAPRRSDRSTFPPKTREQSQKLIQESTLRLLHFTEFTVLVEYVEIIVPLIYAMYLMICFRLPNRQFYSQLRSIEPDRLSAILTNVLLYALLELASLVLFSLVLRRSLPVSPIYQLAFVLEKQWWLIQFKLSFWVIFVVMQSLEHSGADYSFQFNWLRHP